MFDQNSNPWPKFKFLTKIESFHQNWNFSPKLKFFTKIEILYQNLFLFCKIGIINNLTKHLFGTFPEVGENRRFRFHSNEPFSDKFRQLRFCQSFASSPDEPKYYCPPQPRKHLKKLNSVNYFNPQAPALAQIFWPKMVYVWFLPKFWFLTISSTKISIFRQNFEGYQQFLILIKIEFMDYYFVLYC